VSNAGWANSFVAMSVALGSERAEAVTLLAPGEAAHARRLARALAEPARTARAKALSEALAAILLDVAALEATP